MLGTGSGSRPAFRTQKRPEVVRGKPGGVLQAQGAGVLQIPELLGLGGAGPGARWGDLSGPEAPQQLKELDLPADLP